MPCITADLPQIAGSRIIGVLRRIIAAVVDDGRITIAAVINIAPLVSFEVDGPNEALLIIILAGYLLIEGIVMRS